MLPVVLLVLVLAGQRARAGQSLRAELRPGALLELVVAVLAAIVVALGGLLLLDPVEIRQVLLLGVVVIVFLVGLGRCCRA